MIDICVTPFFFATGIGRGGVTVTEIVIAVIVKIVIAVIVKIVIAAIVKIVIAVIAIVTEKGSVTKSVTAIGTVNVKGKESRKNRMANTHSTTTRTKWTTTIWRWWIETRLVPSSK